MAGWLNILSDSLWYWLYRGDLPERYWREGPGQLKDQHMSENHKLLALTLDVLCYPGDQQLYAQLLELLRRPLGREGEPLAGYMPHWLFPVEALRREKLLPKTMRVAAADFEAQCLSWLILHLTPGGPITTGGRNYNPIDDADTLYDENALLDAYARWALGQIKTDKDLGRFMAPGEANRWDLGNPDKPWRGLFLMMHPPHGRAYRPQTRSAHKIRTTSPYIFVAGRNGQFTGYWPYGLPGVPSHMVPAASYIDGKEYVARPAIPTTPVPGGLVAARPDPFYVQAINILVSTSGVDNNALVCSGTIRPVDKKLAPIGPWRDWFTTIPCVPHSETLAVWQTSQTAPPVRLD